MREREREYEQDWHTSLLFIYKSKIERERDSKTDLCNKNKPQKQQLLIWFPSLERERESWGFKLA